VPVEFSVGIIPEHYLFEIVRKAVGGSTEILGAGNTPQTVGQAKAGGDFP
jgi:hypothetical protein